MVNQHDVLDVIGRANPHPDADELSSAAWPTAVLLAEIDTRRQQMGIDLETREAPVIPTPPKRNFRWIAAAAAFVVTIAVVGLVAWLGGVEDVDVAEPATSTTTQAPATSTTTQAPATSTTTQAPATTTTIAETPPGVDPEALTTEQVAFVESYFGAFNAGDIDGFFAHFADGFKVVDRPDQAQETELGPGDPGYENLAFGAPRFMMNMGTEFEPDLDGCRVTEATIRCTAWRTGPLISRTLLRVQHVIRLDLEDGAIVRIDDTCRSCGDGTLGSVLGPWAAWMYERDPDLARKMMIHGNGWPVFTDESAELWLEYLPIYFEEGL
jgi:hypothetical protein